MVIISKKLFFDVTASVLNHGLKASRCSSANTNNRFCWDIIPCLHQCSLQFLNIGVVFATHLPL